MFKVPGTVNASLKRCLLQRQCCRMTQYVRNLQFAELIHNTACQSIQYRSSRLEFLIDVKIQYSKYGGQEIFFAFCLNAVR